MRTTERGGAAETIVAVLTRIRKLASQCAPPHSKIFPYVKFARYDYDAYGNVTRLEERASGGEDIRAEIEYWDNESRYFHAHPAVITVRGSVSGLLRKRRGQYQEETGALVTLTQYAGETPGAGDSTSHLEWDGYGNVSRITDPNGAYAAYAYETEHRQYPAEITAGGPGILVPYQSYLEWDGRFGKKMRETDENRQVITYEYDGYGRPVTVRSPYAFT